MVDSAGVAGDRQWTAAVYQGQLRPGSVFPESPIPRLSLDADNILPIYRWGNCDSETIGDLLKTPRPVGDKGWI